MRESVVSKKFYTKKLPPEGGWGYVVASGLAVSFAVTWSNTTFSLLFHDFLASLGKESSALIILITGTYQSVGNFTGLLASALLKRFSLRTVGTFGSIVFCIGSLSTIFVESVTHIFISYSILQGFGNGLMVVGAYAAFNQYFAEKRVLIMSTTKTFIGFGSMLYPMFVQFLMEFYGFRGAVAVLAAMNLHTIFGMIVLHPIEWHYKTVKIEVKEPIYWVNVANSQVEVDVLTQKMRESDLKANCDGNEQSKINKWQKIIEYLDLALLKDAIFVNMIIGASFAICSDSSFLTLQPLYLLSKGFSKADTALILSTGAAIDLISRICMAIISVWIRVKARYIFLVGAILLVILRFLFLKISSFIGTLIITGAIGFFHPWIVVSTSLVFAEYLPQDKFAFGFGFYLFVQGNLGFIIGPTIGWIRDVTQSYELCFHSLTLAMCVCIIPWMIEIICCKLHPKINKD